ncbi:hypothetical protein [Streptomyces sp. NBC_00046]|uniref:hypothetical protein n=1 Tax=Streptomyces sp. NBC_00046 TaxID=2975626 RepID=UPI0032550764
MADSPKADLWKATKHPRMRPWLAVAAEVPATFAAHHYWGDSVPAAIGLTIAAGVLTAATWWAGEGTKTGRRVHATLSTGVGTAYLVVGTVTGPFEPAMASVLVIGGSVAAGSWNIRQALRVNVDPQKEGGSVETGILVKSIGNAKAALRGQPKVEPNKVTAPLKLDGITNDELGNRLKEIAVELGIAPTSARLQPDPERADHTNLVIVPQDMLKTSVVWPGPSNPDGSITDPIAIGIYEDGQEAVLWFPYDDQTKRNGTHFLAAGMNGSAKSTGISVAMTEVLTKPDVIVWGVDPSKGMQTFAAFLPYMDWVEMTEAGGNNMIDALSQVITARANTLGQHGFKNWTPAAFEQLGMPYMIVWIEEAAKFFRNGTEMEGLGSIRRNQRHYQPSATFRYLDADGRPRTAGRRHLLRRQGLHHRRHGTARRCARRRRSPRSMGEPQARIRLPRGPWRGGGALRRPAAHLHDRRRPDQRDARSHNARRCRPNHCRRCGRGLRQPDPVRRRHRPDQH